MAENKKEVDSLIHRLVEVDYKNCPVTWKEVKRRMADDEAGLVSRLKDEWAERKS